MLPKIRPDKQTIVIFMFNQMLDIFRDNPQNTSALQFEFLAANLWFIIYLFIY